MQSLSYQPVVYAASILGNIADKLGAAADNYAVNPGDLRYYAVNLGRARNELFAFAGKCRTVTKDVATARRAELVGHQLMEVGREIRMLADELDNGADATAVGDRLAGFAGTVSRTAVAAEQI